MLEDEQKLILVGWVYHKYLKGEVVHRKTAVDFINETFCVKVSDKTAGTYLNELGMGVRISQKKSAGFPVDKEDSSIMILEWLKTHHNSIVNDLTSLSQSVSDPPPSTTNTTTTTRSASALLGAGKRPDKRSRGMDRSRLASV